MTKTSRDEEYEKGQKDGLDGTILDDLAEYNSPKCSEKEEAYHKGYDHGRSQREEHLIAESKRKREEETKQNEEERHSKDSYSHKKNSSSQTSRSSEYVPLYREVSLDDVDSDSDGGYYGGSGYYGGTSAGTLTQKTSEVSGKQLLAGVAILGGVIVLGVYYNDLTRSRTSNLVESGIVFNYELGGKLQERHINSMRFDDPGVGQINIVSNRAYRGFVGLSLSFPIITHEGKINIPIEIPDESITKFEKQKVGWFKSREYLVEGPLASRLDKDNSRDLTLEELAVFYDFTGKSLDDKLHLEGYFAPATFFSQKSKETLEKDIEKKARDWMKNEFIPNYLITTSPIETNIAQVLDMNNPEKTTNSQSNTNFSK